MSEPEDPRENLITTAVNFLKNPKVQSSPLATKQAFLEKKGLTKPEIDIAVQRSGVREHDPIRDVGHAPTGSPSYHSPLGGAQGYMTPYNPHIVPANSTWSKVRDFTAFAIVVGGVGVGVYRLYQHVIKPYLFGVHQKSVEKQVLEMQEELTKTLVKVQENLLAIQEALKRQEDTLQQLAIQSGAKKTEEKLGQLRDSQLVNELKSEVSSIKGLLLNRRQFPPAPTTTPVLPSWQRSKASSAAVREPGPSGEGEDGHQAEAEKPDSGVGLQTTGVSVRLEERATDTNNGLDVRDFPVNDLITANKNNGTESETPFDSENPENDELDPSNQILAEQNDRQPVESGSSTYVAQETAVMKKGILAKDDSTVEVVS